MKNNGVQAGAATGKRTIFLSYGRGDDEPFVKRLYEQLTAAGYEVWWDRVAMPNRGLTFLHEIRDAIDRSDRLVLVLGPAAVRSDYVIAEWRHALEFGKVVHPVLRLGDFDLAPRELALVHIEDFRDDTRFAHVWSNLDRQLADAVAPMGKLVGVPSLPLHTLARANALSSLKEAVLADLMRPRVLSGAAARIGLHGMGGIGKSVLANTFARDADVRRAFPDGVLWLRVGVHGNIEELQRKAISLFGEMSSSREDPGKRLAEVLTDRAVLLVLDDVWRRADADAFDVLGAKCRMLITTRDAGLATSFCATHYAVDLFSIADSRSLMAKAADIPEAALPLEAEQVIQAVGRLPLAIALCGGMYRRGAAWPEILERLRSAALERIADRNASDEIHESLWTALKVGVDALSADERQRFMELSVLLGEAPEAAAATLWAHTGACDKFAIQDLLISLHERSLIQLRDDSPRAGEAPVRRIVMHDLLRDYALRVAGNPTSLHRALSEAYRQRCTNGWATGPDDGYFFEHIVEHLSLGEESADLSSILADGDWRRKQRDRDPSLTALLADLEVGLNRAEAATPPAVADIAAYRLLIAKLRTQVEDAPVEAMAALTRLGRWREALVYTLSSSSPEQRLIAQAKIVEVLREIGEVNDCRDVAERALQYAETLDPAIAGLRGSAPPDFRELVRRVVERIRADKTTRLESLARAYIKDEKVLNDIRAFDGDFVLLSPRAERMRTGRFAYAARSLRSAFLAHAHLPRSAADIGPKPFEIQSLDLTRLLASTERAKELQYDIIRGVSARLLALQDLPDAALLLASEIDEPEERFHALAAIALAYSRQGNLAGVEGIWDLVKDLDSARYVGDRALRCEVMTCLAGALRPVGGFDLARAPMWSAILFSARPGLPMDLLTNRNRSAEEAERVMREVRLREARENMAQTFAKQSPLTRLESKFHLQSAMVAHFPEDSVGPAKMVDEIRDELQTATPETWHVTPQEYLRDRASGMCLLALARMNLGDRNGAYALLCEAETLSSEIVGARERAGVLALIADAYARSGEDQPADVFRRKFLELIEPPDVYGGDSDKCLVQWARAALDAGALDEAAALAGQLRTQETRGEASTLLALGYARAGDHARAAAELEAGPATEAEGIGWTRRVAVLRLLGDEAQADDVLQRGLARIEAAEREYQRIEYLRTALAALWEDGEAELAFQLCETREDATTRGVMFAALLGVAVKSSHEIDEEGVFNLASWAGGTIATQMDPSEYHFCLACLMTADAIQKSGFEAGVSRRLELDGELSAGLENQGFNALGALIERDGEVGALRAFTVLGIANGGLPDDVLSAIDKPLPDLWSWIRQKRTQNLAGSARSAESLVADLRKTGRQAVWEVWRALGAHASVLFEARAFDEVLTRIAAVNIESPQSDGATGQSDWPLF